MPLDCVLPVAVTQAGTGTFSLVSAAPAKAVAQTPCRDHKKHRERF